MSKQSEIESDEEEQRRSKQKLAALNSKANLIPAYSSASALNALLPDTEKIELGRHLRKASLETINGDLARPEEMLINQAIVLDTIFTRFTEKMANSEHLVQFEAYGKIALRAQNQSQRNLKTLLELKNPKRATFIKQQNNAVNQQINEGSLEETLEIEINPANELLERKNAQWLDTPEKRETITVDTKLEAVGKLDRAED